VLARSEGKEDFGMPLMNSSSLAGSAGLIQENHTGQVSNKSGIRDMTGDMLAANNPAILSMLRTSTDTGDLGGLPFTQNRLPRRNGPTHKRSHMARLSDGSIRINNTGSGLQIPSRKATPSSRDVSPAGHRGSISSVQTTRTNPTSKSDRLGLIASPPPLRYLPQHLSPSSLNFDQRSYSLTGPRMVNPLAAQRSVGRLRSQFSAPRVPNRRAQYIGGTYAPQQHTGRSGSPTSSEYHMRHHNLHNPRYMQRQQYPQQNDFNSMQPMPHTYLRYAPSSNGTKSAYNQVNGRGQVLHGPSQQYMYPAYNTNSLQRPSYDYNVPLLPGQRIGLYMNDQEDVYEDFRDVTPPELGSQRISPYAEDPMTPQDVQMAGPIIIQTDIDEDFHQHADLHDDIPSENAAFSDYVAYTTKAENAVVHDDMQFKDEKNLEDAVMQQEDSAADRPVSLEKESAVIPSRSASSLDAASDSNSGSLVKRIKTLLESQANNTTQHDQQLHNRRKDEYIGVKSKIALAQSTALHVDIDKTVPAQPEHHLKDSRAGVRITRELVKLMTSPSVSEHETTTVDVTHQHAQQRSVSSANSPSSCSLVDNPDDDLLHTNGNVESHKVLEPTTENKEPRVSVSNRSAERETDYIEGPTDNGNQNGSDQISVVLADTYSTPGVRSRSNVHMPGEFPDDISPEEIEPEIPSLVHSTNSSLCSTPQKLDFTKKISPHHSTRPSSLPSLDKSISTQTSQLPIALADPDCKNTVKGSLNKAELNITGHDTTNDDDDDDDYDAPAGVTSDIVTDIAIRFSIPRRVSVAKPSIVEVLPEGAESKPAESKTGLDSQRHFAEPLTGMTALTIQCEARPEESPQVSPAEKPDETFPPTVQGADLSSFIRRSFPRRHSAFFRDRERDKATEKDGSVTVKGQENNIKYIENYERELADLTEESHEDSVNQIKIADPGTELLSTTTIVPSTHAGMSLAEIRNLPSLNFSRINLFDQLNSAFKHNHADLELPATHAGLGLLTLSGPSSAEASRQRLTEAEGNPVGAPSGANTTFDMINALPITILDDVHNYKKVTTDVGNNTCVQRNSTISSHLAPELLLGIAYDAERLTVPSIDGLTHRLSEILPSLKRLHLASVIADEDAVKHTIDEIHHLGERPTSMTSVRSSGVLRSLAAIANDIVINGTHSSQYLRAAPQAGTPLAILPATFSAGSAIRLDSTHALDTTDLTDNTLTSRGSQASQLRRVKSENRINSKNHLPLPPIVSNLQSRRSFTISTPASRPWNFDENYPWSSKTDNVEIDFPTMHKDRQSIASDVLRKTATMSTQHLNNDLDPLQLLPDSPSSSASGLEHQTATVSADTMTSAHHTRKISLKAASLLGSLTRRHKMTSPPRPSLDSGRSSNTTKRLESAAKAKRKQSKDRLQSHAVGDRYPCTALQAPSGYDLDEVRSYFSDDDDSRTSTRPATRTGRTTTLKKRLSSLKFRVPPAITISRPASELDGHNTNGRSTRTRSRSVDQDTYGFSLDRSRQTDHDALEDARFASDETGSLPVMSSNRWQYDTNAVSGMGKVEFRIRKVGEKLRSVFARGGALLRRLSGKNKRERRRRDRDEWIDGSIYSGT